MSWLVRGRLGGPQAGAQAARASGGAWLLAAVPGEDVVALDRAARAGLRERSAAVLAAAGLGAGERAVVSLGADGDLAAASIADAVVEAGASAAVVGPRGRMRLLAAMRTVRPRVWITTPTGALDYLARLYLEFNVDPLELELEQILLVGEIPSEGTSRRLAGEFEARVTGLYVDPIFGGVWAHGRDGRWSGGDPAVVARAALDHDAIVAEGVAPGGVGGRDGASREGADAAPVLQELVLRPDWAGPFAGAVLRTGQVVRAGALPGTRTDAGDPGSLFHHTVGDHLLVRGRWLSLPALRAALARIDGLAGHRVGVERGEGTLDRLVITLAFARPSLVENPMWVARAREAIAATTPVRFELVSALAEEGTPSQLLEDRRGHHLGLERSSLACGGGSASHGA